MAAHPLDNPIWNALATHHAGFAQGDCSCKRYPAQVAPFAAVPAELEDRPLPQGFESRDSICFVGVLPAFDVGWVCEQRFDLLQMILPQNQRASNGASFAFRELTEADVAAMLDLTARVFPGYFRERTHLMGRYLGIFAEGELVVMAGERMAIDGWCEISAVCTDPRYTGRGYAGALVQILVDDMLNRGVTPFLHVSPENTRARQLYRTLGFDERAMLPFVRVHSL